MGAYSLAGYGLGLVSLILNSFVADPETRKRTRVLLWGTAGALVPLIIVGTYAEAARPRIHRAAVLGVGRRDHGGPAAAVVVCLRRRQAPCDGDSGAPPAERSISRRPPRHHRFWHRDRRDAHDRICLGALAYPAPTTRRDRLGRTLEWRRRSGVRGDRRTRHAAGRARGNRAARSGVLPWRVRRASPVAGSGTPDQQRDRSERACDTARRLADRGPASECDRRDAANVERSAGAGCAGGQWPAKPRRSSSGSGGVNAQGRHRGESR